MTGLAPEGEATVSHLAASGPHRPGLSARGAGSGRHAAYLVSAAALLLSSGCQLAPALPPARSERALPAHVTVLKHHPRHPPKPEPKKTEIASPRDASPATTASESPPVKLIGLDPMQLETLLGAPGSKQSEGLGQKWTYRAGDCAVSISLYRNVDTREFRALSYEVSGNDPTGQGEHNCLRRLASRSGKRASP